MFWFCISLLGLPEQSTTNYDLIMTTMTLLSQSSGGKKFEIKILAGLVPSEGCQGRIHFRLLSLAYRSITPISALIFTWHSRYVRVCDQISPFYRAPIILDYELNPLQNDLILTNCIYKELISKYGHFLRYWGSGL